MSGSVNKVILVGNLGRDPEIRTFQNGGRVARLAIATSESWKDKSSGERKERTEWHRVSIINDKLAEIAEKYLRKGSKVYLEGQLETSKWQDKDGNEKYTTEVVLRPYRGELTLLDKRDGQGGGYAQALSDGEPGALRQVTGGAAAGGLSGGGALGSTAVDLDDDIPF